jgi:hypothetical protein
MTKDVQLQVEVVTVIEEAQATELLPWQSCSAMHGPLAWERYRISFPRASSQEQRDDIYLVEDSTCELRCVEILKRDQDRASLEQGGLIHVGHLLWRKLAELKGRWGLGISWKIHWCQTSSSCSSSSTRRDALTNTTRGPPSSSARAS